METLRAIIEQCAPTAIEEMSYGIIGYKLNKKPLVYIGGFKHHAGLYATPAGHDAFREKLKGYKQGKGSVKFPVSQPLPVDLIRELIEARVAEIQKKQDSHHLDSQKL